MANEFDCLNVSVSDILDAFAGGREVPGSGSAAALIGAIAAGLVCTVASLTVEKSADATFQSEAAKICEEAKELMVTLRQAVQDDTDSFAPVVRKRKARDAAKRDGDMKSYSALEQEADELLAPVIQLPLRIAQSCIRIACHAVVLKRKGFRAACGDAGTAYVAALAAAEGAIACTTCNFSAIRGKHDWRDALERQAFQIVVRIKELRAMTDEVLNTRVLVRKTDDSRK